jgi:hypothetical protein
MRYCGEFFISDEAYEGLVEWGKMEGVKIGDEGLRIGMEGVLKLLSEKHFKDAREQWAKDAVLWIDPDVVRRQRKIMITDETCVKLAVHARMLHLTHESVSESVSASMLLEAVGAGWLEVLDRMDEEAAYGYLVGSA